MSATGRQRSVGADRGIFATATWYAGATGRERPGAAGREKVIDH